MRLEIRSRDLRLSEKLDTHIRQRFERIFERASARIAAVIVRLRDVNGKQRGGIDKQCQVEVVFEGQVPVLVRETSANVYAAVDRAAQRTKHTVFERARSMRERKRARRSSKP